jgi:hypothetical protein
MNLKSALSAIGAGALGICGFIAGMPAQLESQIPQLFPENQRAYFAVVFGVAAYAAHHYSVSARTPTEAPAVPLPAPPVQTTKP